MIHPDSEGNYTPGPPDDLPPLPDDFVVFDGLYDAMVSRSIAEEKAIIGGKLIALTGQLDAVQGQFGTQPDGVSYHTLYGDDLERRVVFATLRRPDMGSQRHVIVNDLTDEQRHLRYREVVVPLGLPVVTIRSGEGSRDSSVGGWSDEDLGPAALLIKQEGDRYQVLRGLGNHRPLPSPESAPTTFVRAVEISNRLDRACDFINGVVNGTAGKVPGLSAGTWDEHVTYGSL